MGFQANVLKVMVASPGDVAVEREIVTQELYRWNNANSLSRRLMLQPVKWETHSAPQMGAHPQAILNEHLLLDADILVGIFGTRIGTATPEFISGSVEEIKRHVAAGKLAMLYFSHVPVDPHAIDQGQWAALQTFKEECRSGGLYAEYGSHDQLRSDFGHHLTIELNRPKYLWMTPPDANIVAEDPELSTEEIHLLLATAADRNGQILTGSTMGGFFVQAKDENFVEDTPRSAAVWKRVLRRLSELGYLSQVNEEVYELTEEGFARADKETANAPLEVSLSFAGTSDHQLLCAKSNKPIAVKQIDFLMSSEAYVTSSELSEEIGVETKIPLDPKKIGELFAAPRPDKNYADHAEPAALRVVFMLAGLRKEVVLPVVLQPTFVNNTQWIQLTGSKTFTLS
ncbi:MAG TPA: hypothetical protein VFE38_02085 [Edaphobacter sp.]|nr:hypothetical protein [Edaphobacter sp.]